jgi:NADPH:quinone reductase-like Zn-dependent oxidoreductase
MGTPSLPLTMRAQVLSVPGRPLEEAELPVPRPGPGQVLVRIEAAGLNPLDVKIAAGEAAHARVTRLPAVLGLDAAGVVVATGPGATDLAVGQEVYGMIGGVGDVQGSLAEYAAVDAALLAPKPPEWSMVEAAALPLSVITAWEGLVDRAGVREGHAVLVHGGAGGVGHVAVQLARARGARVWASGSQRQVATLQRLGAVPIDREAPVEGYVAEHTGGEGFDVVLDTVGGANLDRSFVAVKHYTGHVVSSLGWGTHSLAPLSFRGATYSGVFTLLPLLTGRGRAAHGRILASAAALAADGRLRPFVHPEHHALADAEAALRQVARGVPVGKVVVDLTA